LDLIVPLATIYDYFGWTVRKLRANQAVAIFAAFDYQHKGLEYINKSKWPIQWEDSIQRVAEAMVDFQAITNGTGLNMRDRLKGTPLTQPISPTSPSSIKIVTVCDYDDSITPLSILSRINKEEYARKHGYKFFYYDKSPFYQDWFTSNGGIDRANRPPAWGKIDAVLNALTDGDINDWIMWMDCDSFFLDMDVALVDVIERIGKIDRAKEGGMVDWRKSVSSWKPRIVADAINEYNAFLDSLNVDNGRLDIITSEDGLMLNTGIFLVRNSLSSFRLLQRVRQFTFYHNPAMYHTWWEQTGMMFVISIPYLLESVPFEDFSAKSNWGIHPRVTYIKQRLINVYPPMIASMLKTHAPYADGDFIISFSGCKTFTSQKVCNQLFFNYFDRVPDLVGRIPVYVTEKFEM
jgi:hypothetical protein